MKLGNVHGLERLLLLLLRLKSWTSGIAVFGEQRHAAECFAARWTRVLFHVRVGLQVRAQIRAVRERPVAVLARERLLARVRAYMALQQPGPAERLAAQLAYARQRVSADVHLESAQRVVRLVTVLAAERLGRGRGAGALVVRTVVLVVFGEPGHGQVSFGARVTLVPVGGRRGDGRPGRRWFADDAAWTGGDGGRRVALAGTVLLVRWWRQLGWWPVRW